MVLMPSLPWGEKNKQKTDGSQILKEGLNSNTCPLFLTYLWYKILKQPPPNTHQPTHRPIQSKLTKRKTVWWVVLKRAVPWSTTKFTPTSVWTILLRHPPSQPPTPKRLLDLHAVKTMRCTPPQSTPHRTRRYFLHSHTQRTASRFSHFAKPFSTRNTKHQQNVCYQKTRTKITKETKRG